MPRLAHLFSSAAALVAALSAIASSQAPNERWRTIETPHFNVHFPQALEPIARRAAGSAERAYERLAPLLKPARGRIDLAVTDHVDYSNGYAYVSPSPRMVIFARPPVDDRTLRFREDWLDLVIQHELVHVFQLDRTRGWWSVAQLFFGRQPLLFPNVWAPSWLLEGLAVHYESKLGDGGRNEGLAHVPFVNGRAADGALPRLGAWSLASLDFPGGSNAYIYGSLLVQSMEAHGGAGSVERFVERSSGRSIPWAFEGDASQEFGTGFAAQWTLFADSVTRVVRGALTTPALRTLTPASWYARFPRRTSDGRTLFVAANGRDVTGLYELSADAGATPRRIARRNSLQPNVPQGDGRVVFAQSEWADPWRLWSDLWIREADGREHALTSGARLFAPDARSRDGAIVAVQDVPGTTRLVRVDASGAIAPITTSHIDTTWSAPRWSHDGTRIAATRWVRGGVMSIVILDSLGHSPRVVASARATVDEPSWSLDDASVLFSVNGAGTAAIWSADVATGAVRSMASGPTSYDAPEAVPGGIMAVETRGAGERLVLLAPSAAGGDVLPSIAEQQPSPSAAPAQGPVKKYRSLRQLVPRYWLPVSGTSDENHAAFGALVSGSDIVGRHFYAAQLLHEFDRGENSGSMVYRYAGFGQPFVDIAAQQEWEHAPVFDSTRRAVGTLGWRRRFVGASLTMLRQRVRNTAVLSGGAQMEFRDFTTYPASLLPRLADPLYLKTLKYPTFSLLAAWANTRTPILALGPEDGISLSGYGRWRWRTDDAAATRSATYISTVGAYKSIGFIAGPAHHVMALRAAVGTSDDKTNSELEAGGVSGTSAELAPGINVGDVRRDFFVRGFAPGAQRGIRALGGSAEWRAPLAMPGWGSGFVPFFAQRVSATFFADGGAAWCPAGSRSGTIGCPKGPTFKEWMTSVGGELALDAAVLNYDMPYRLRLGFARPMRGRAYADAPNGSAYFSLGLSF